MYWRLKQRLELQARRQDGKTNQNRSHEITEGIRALNSNDLCPSSFSLFIGRIQYCKPNDKCEDWSKISCSSWNSHTIFQIWVLQKKTHSFHPPKQNRLKLTKLRVHYGAAICDFYKMIITNYKKFYRYHFIKK